MSRYDFLLNNRAKDEQPPKETHPKPQEVSREAAPKQPKPVKEKASISSKTEQNLFDHSPVLSRPKGFYITEKQDKEIDRGVRKLSEKTKGKVLQKIDRSTLLRLILDEIDLADDQTINQLYNRLNNRLVNQLTN